MAARRRAVSDLMRKGVFCAREIARRLKQPRTSVQRDVDVIHAAWLKDVESNAKGALARQLKSIQWRRWELVEQWGKSIGAVTTTTTKVRDGATETTTTVKHQCGDPRYMVELRELDKQEAELIGLNRSKDSESDPALDPNYKDPVYMTDEELLDEYADYVNRFAEHAEKKRLDAAGLPGGYRNHPQRKE